jgi:hypothetical protein
VLVLVIVLVIEFLFVLVIVIVLVIGFCSCAPRRGDPVNSPGWRHGFMCRYPGSGIPLSHVHLKGWHKASPLWDPVRVHTGGCFTPGSGAVKLAPPPGAIHGVTPSGCTRAKADYEDDYDDEHEQELDYEHEHEHERKDQWPAELILNCSKSTLQL